jgi:hypothetical protein
LADWDAEYGVQADGDLSLPFYLDRCSHLLYGFLYHKLSTSIEGYFLIMAIMVRYNLTGSGWAECIVEIDDRQAHLTASYLSDALADLLDAVECVVRGIEDATALFIEEPGEYRWRFRRISPDRLWVQIIEFDEPWKNRPDAEGKLIFDVECRLRSFAGAVLSASQQVLATHGFDGYRKQWVNRDFPIDLQAKLKASLDRLK